MSTPQRREYIRRRLAERTHWLDMIRSEVGCERCGRKDGRLEFHHRNPDEKTAHVTQLQLGGVPRLVAEIEKCEVLCSSCHGRVRRSRGRMRTKAEGGYEVSYHTQLEHEAEQVLQAVRNVTATFEPC